MTIDIKHSARRLALSLAGLSLILSLIPATPVLAKDNVAAESATAQDQGSASASTPPSTREIYERKGDNGKDLRPPNLEQGEEVPWLYENSNVPIEKEWDFGKLKNGVRYAVRHNGVPPGQVSVRLRIDAGSMMESDSEQGYAHLLEHMLFRGSKSTPDGEAVRIWQRLGATFGSDSNAETTPTHTVYKLDLPNVTEAGLDEGMKLLAEMVREPLLSKQGLAAEVPVVLAELNQRSGLQIRVGDATRNLYFAGQRLAVRSPIGTPETLQAATDKSLRAFYKRWYRPENTVISIAGDVDPAMLEALVAKYFGDWKVSGKPTAAPDFGDPDPSAPATKVMVEPELPVTIQSAWLRRWRPVNDTVEYNEQLLMDLLALQILNRQLESKARLGGSFLQAGVSTDDISRSADGTFLSILANGNDWKSALADVRKMIANATTHAPTQEQIDRELSEFDSLLQVGVEGARSEAGSKQADSIVEAVDIRESVASAQAALDIFRNMKDKYTPENLLRSFQALFGSDIQRTMLIIKEDDPQAESDLASIMATPVEAESKAALEEQKVSFDDLPDLGEPGSVVSATPTGLLDIETVELSNGVKAILFPNDAEASKIMVKVRFGNGYQSFPANKKSLIWSGEAAMGASGIGDLDQEKIDRLLTGRRIGLEFNVENDAFSFSADTRASDLEDQLHLIAAKMVEPRWDAAPVNRIKSALKLTYNSYASSATSMLDRDLSWLTHGRDERWKTPDPDDIEALTPERFRETWEPLLKQGPIEVMLFGDFVREDAIAALEKTFGAMPAREAAAPVPGSAKVSFPGDTKPVILRHNSKDQAALMIAWSTSGGREKLHESRQLEILSSIFTNRLIDKLRSADGTSYSPYVSNSWPLEFESGGYLGVLGVVTPANIPHFVEATQQIASDLATTPVSEDELARATEPLRQLIARASSGNGFWLTNMEGASRDPSRIEAVRSIMRDYSVTTPEAMQQLAQKYLGDKKPWRLLVLPEDEKVPDLP